MAAFSFITNEGFDFLAKAVGGSVGGVNTIYIEFDNDATVVFPEEDKSAGRSYYSELSGTKDYLRVAILNTPKYSGTSDDYTSNSLSVLAVASGSTGVNGLAFSEAAGSKVYGAALVYAEDSDEDNDVVVSRHYFAAEKSKEDSEDLVVRVTLELT